MRAVNIKEIKKLWFEGFRPWEISKKDEFASLWLKPDKQEHVYAVTICTK